MDCGAQPRETDRAATETVRRPADCAAGLCVERAKTVASLRYWCSDCLKNAALREIQGGKGAPGPGTEAGR